MVLSRTTVRSFSHFRWPNRSYKESILFVNFLLKRDYKKISHRCTSYRYARIQFAVVCFPKSMFHWVIELDPLSNVFCVVLFFGVSYYNTNTRFTYHFTPPIAVCSSVLKIETVSSGVALRAMAQLLWRVLRPRGVQLNSTAHQHFSELQVTIYFSHKSTVLDSSIMANHVIVNV